VTAPATLWLVHALGDSSQAFRPLFDTELARRHALVAPDWPAAAGPVPRDLDDLAAWLAGQIEQRSAAGPIGLVGHSLGAAVAVRAASRLRNVVGLVSIEGNLTAADAYLSGLAADFEAPEAYVRHLLHFVQSLADDAGGAGRDALLRYHASLGRSAPEPLWRIGRAAKAASRDDGLGQEYRALAVRRLYYWSADNTPAETQAFIRRQGLEAAAFKGGHWPMVEQPEATARRLLQFFDLRPTA
jgi:pimeloyl-ACP methyl ester carboxylesterase